MGVLALQDGNLAALDLMSAASMINYFGKAKIDILRVLSAIYIYK